MNSVCRRGDFPAGAGHGGLEHDPEHEFSLSKECVLPWGSWDALADELRRLGLDGVEGIADPDYYDDAFPASLLTGYHMTFYPDWVDFWHGDEAALIRKFGSLEGARGFYRCASPEEFLGLFRADFRLARRLGARYLVFHVSDVSIEEGYTYRWEHGDREVMDAALEIINAVLEDAEPDFDFLVENQWWPGFTFTEPEKTEYLLSRIRYPRVGIMLDTGHLMNTEWRIRTQAEGVDYILAMLEKHGSLSRYVRGLHFHESLSGAYCRRTIGRVPDGFPEDYYEAFSVSYGHILKIDRHNPWTDPACVRILDAVGPQYLTHELSAKPRRSQIAAVRRQLETIRKGKKKEDTP